MSSISYVYYTPSNPASVTTVSRMQLFATAARTGTPIVDIGGPVLQANGSWMFSVPTPAPGYYYATVTVTYTDGQTFDDTNDIIQLPAPPALAPDENWVAAWELDPNNPDAIDAAKTASFIMYTLSGRKYPGQRTVTETYTLPQIAANNHYRAQTEAFLSHRIARGFYYPTRDPSFRRDYLYLRGRPVRSIQAVFYGPDFITPLDPTTYRVYDRSILEVDGGIQWETRVQYTYGTRPPAMGRRAARSLGNEILKSLAGSSDCKLPERVRSMVRQGTSITLLDPHEFLDKGRTGLYDVDLFLAAVNPNNAQARAKTFSPDKPRVRRITG